MSGAFPPPLVPASPTSADWPDVGAAVIEDEASLEFIIVPGEEGRPSQVVAVLDHRRRLKVLSEAGLAAARVELPLDGFSTVREIRARSVSRDGVVSTMSTAAITRASWDRASRDVKGLGRLRLNIPDVEVGGLIEYRYERVFADAAFAPLWVFGSKYPVLRSEMAFVFGPGIRLDYRFGRGEKVEEYLPLSRQLADGRQRLVFVLQNLPPYYDEPDMLNLARVAPWVAAEVMNAALPEGARRMETWDALGLHLKEYLDRVGGPPGTGTPAARYRAVRDGLRAIDFPGLGGLPALSATRIMNGAAVTSRDAAALLIAALAGSGVEAFPALIESPIGPPAAPDFPALYPFMRLLVAVPALGPAAERDACGSSRAELDPVCRTAPSEYLLLDATCGYCRYGELPWDLHGGRALVLGVDGPDWIPVHDTVPEAHALRLRFEARFEASGEVKGTVEGDARGNTAGLLRELATRAKGDLDERVTAAIYGTGTQAKLSAVQIEEGGAEQAAGFKATGRGLLEKLGYERFRVHPRDLVGVALPGDWRKTRRYDAVLQGPRVFEMVATLELPVGYSATLPAQVRLRNAYLEYAAGFDRRERVLTYTRRVRVLRQIVPAADWDAFRSLQEQIEREDEQGVRIWVAE